MYLRIAYFPEREEGEGRGGLYVTLGLDWRKKQTSGTTAPSKHPTRGHFFCNCTLCQCCKIRNQPQICLPFYADISLTGRQIEHLIFHLEISSTILKAITQGPKSEWIWRLLYLNRLHWHEIPFLKTLNNPTTFCKSFITKQD